MAKLMHFAGRVNILTLFCVCRTLSCYRENYLYFVPREYRLDVPVGLLFHNGLSVKSPIFSGEVEELAHSYKTRKGDVGVSFSHATTCSPPPAVAISWIWA
jgi:hypothetical protein